MSKESHNLESTSVISAIKAESIFPYSFQLLKNETQYGHQSAEKKTMKNTAAFAMSAEMSS